ncbi:hypothetical protein [Rugamonas sp. DEMB1]|uniref:hypothetical protein n=1 Tax=Rugamonas sp. DEMB1 TaxID=3039386 RepID=UPI002448FDD2|nr:hypothetical protein [Rugamonas sp. DEMB1]WGG52529.1 hypothetical protein QC826_10500 [Rugamonas sp. DEMB1]
MALFKRRRRAATDTAGLGSVVIAMRLEDGDVAPADCRVVVFNAAGYARRLPAGRVARGDGETVYCYHPGPYNVELTPFPAAPELGLRLQFVVDAADPRVAQQRFELLLHSEAGPQLGLAEFGASIEQALQLALRQGGLDLPPCTALEEWHSFRAGLNQLLYTRFGVTVDDCFPVDLGERIDFAATLRARAARLAARLAERPPARAPVAAPAAVAPPSGGTNAAVPTEASNAQQGAAAAAAAITLPSSGTNAASPTEARSTEPGSDPRGSDPSPSPRGSPADHAATDDAKALRRLFLELPPATSALRLIALPPSQALFQSHQQLLQRLALSSLSVATMPSLAWAAPDRPLDLVQQRRRASQAIAAVRALDEAWALLARLRLAAPDQLPELFDEADRIIANLDHHLALRRAPFAPTEQECDEAPAQSRDATAAAAPRKEPSL